MSFITDQIMSSVVHELVLAIISKISPQDVWALIQHKVDPIEFFQSNTGGDGTAIAHLVDIARNYANYIDKYVTFNQMLKEAAEHRPDLVPILKTPHGRQWMERYLYITREFLKTGEVPNLK